MTEVIAEAGSIDPRRVAALSGPNLALEIARRLPASAVVAAEDVALADADPGAPRSPSVPAVRQSRRARRRAVRRPQEHRRDRGGRRGGARLRRQRQGGPDDPWPGRDDPGRDRRRREPADLRRASPASATSSRPAARPLSRNHRLGVELARGRTWADIEATLPGVAEGAYTVDAALALADSPRRRDADRPRGPPRAVRGQERPALPDRPAGPRIRRTSSPTTTAGPRAWSPSGRHRSTEVDSSASGRGAAW